MKAKAVPVEVVVGPSEYFKPSFARCLPNVSRLSTSKARCVRSGCTCTGPLDGKLQSSICSSLSGAGRSEEHTSELQSRGHLVCRLLLEKKKNIKSSTEV